MSLQINDTFTAQVAKTLSLTELQVHEIISFQFRTAKEAAHTCNSLELSGMGKFSIRPSVLRKRLLYLDEWEANIDSGKSKDISGRKESIINERASLLNRQEKINKK